jgi:hypothetical protein
MSSPRQSLFLHIIVCLCLDFAWVAAPAWATTSAAAPSTAPAAAQQSAEAPAPATRTKPKIAVVGVALDPIAARAAARLFQLGEMSAESAGRFELIDQAEFLDPAATAEANALRKQIRALVDEAKAAYDELELATAKEKAQEAMALALKADLSKDFDVYVDAQMIQIASLLADAENKAADDLLKTLLPMDLVTPFDPDLFSPDYIALVKAERAALQKAIPKDLDVKVQPVPAQIYLDGRFRGISSVEMHDLAPGDHLVTIIAPGYKRVQRIVSPGMASALTEKLEPTPLNAQYQSLARELRARFQDQGRLDAAQALAKFFEVQQLVILGIRSQSNDSFLVTGIRLDAADGHEYAHLEEPFPNDERQFAVVSNGFFGKMFSVDSPRATGGQAVLSTINPFEWKARHTGYVLLGVAAAAIGSGVTFGLNARSQSNTYADLTAPQTNPVYDRIETVGRRSALISDISFGVAIAAAATGTVLLIKDLIKKESFGGQIDDRAHMTQVGFVAVEEPASPAEVLSPAETPISVEAPSAPQVSKEKAKTDDGDKAASKKGKDKKATKKQEKFKETKKKEVADDWGEGW